MCTRRRSWTKNAVQEISGRTREAGPGRASQLCWQVSKGVWPRHRQTLLNLNPPPRKQRPLPYAALLGSMLCSCTDTISIFSTNLQHFRPEWLRSKPAVKLPLSWDPRLISPLLDRDVAASAVPPNLWYSPNAACRKSWMEGKRESVKREALYYDQRV